MLRETRLNQVRKFQSACHQLSMFPSDLYKKREEKMGHRLCLFFLVLLVNFISDRNQSKLGTQIKMVESPERSGQFSFCSTRTLMLFLILHFPLPLSPALEICPSAIASQSRPGFLCFVKANHCCSTATALLIPMKPNICRAASDRQRIQPVK